MKDVVQRGLRAQDEVDVRQRSTGSGRESESQPLTTEPEVRAELCMPSVERVRGGGGLHFIWHPNLAHWTRYMTV